MHSSDTHPDQTGQPCCHGASVAQATAGDSAQALAARASGCASSAR